MKILVTGAAGKIGRVVVRDLLDAGHSVRAFDRVPLPRDLRDEVETHLGELLDRYAVLRAVEGVDGVAHLAAIPDPMHGNEITLFAPNVLGTQLVLAACENYEVRRVALASSCSVFGFAFQEAPHGEETIEPHFLPVTEDHPIENADVYGLSKQCNEATAAMYSRRSGIATTCLRLSWVNSVASTNRWARRGLERGSDWKSRDLWGYIDERDAARAFRLALERVEGGHRALHISASDYWSASPYRTLVEQHYPALLPSFDRAVEEGYDPSRGGWDTRRAEEVLGWKSQFHWSDNEELRELRDRREEQRISS